jgi:hypothetical protein
MNSGSPEPGRLVRTGWQARRGGWLWWLLLPCRMILLSPGRRSEPTGEHNINAGTVLSSVQHFAEDGAVICVAGLAPARRIHKHFF